MKMSATERSLPLVAEDYVSLRALRKNLEEGLTLSLTSVALGGWGNSGRRKEGWLSAVGCRAGALAAGVRW